jgi:hypothetical protein
VDVSSGHGHASDAARRSSGGRRKRKRHRPCSPTPHLVGTFKGDIAHVKFLHRALVSTLSLLEICPGGNHEVVDPSSLSIFFMG